MSTSPYCTVIVRAVEDTDENGESRFTPPHLKVGTSVTVEALTDDGVTVFWDSVDVTDDNAATDPEVLASELLAKGGYELDELGPEWFPDEHGIKTTGRASRASADATPPPSSPYTDGLRELANWLDAHPEWTPFSGEYLYSWQHNADLSTMARAARDMGTAEKEINENTGTFKLVKRFGPHAFTVLADRAAVCERVVKGRRVVKRVEKVPVGDVVYSEHEVEEVVEEVEWVCPPSILGAAGS
ncbi:hypothetical protein [Thiomonas sp.]